VWLVKQKQVSQACRNKGDWKLDILTDKDHKFITMTLYLQNTLIDPNI